MGVFFLVVAVALMCLLGRVGAVAGKDEDNYCGRVTRCKEGGPTIRFPFWQKNKKQPDDQCGHIPAFELSCRGRRKETVLEFQYLLNTSLVGLQLSFSAIATVKLINYTSQQILLEFFRDNRRPPQLIPTLNSSVANSPPFRSLIIHHDTYRVHRIYNIYYYNPSDWTFFSCPSTEGIDSWMPRLTLTSVSGHAFQGYGFPSDDLTFHEPITSCTKMYTIFNMQPDIFSTSGYNLEPLAQVLTWSAPNCGKCEANGQYCKLDTSTINSNNRSTTCLTPIPEEQQSGGGHASHKPVVAFAIPIAVLFVLLLIAVMYYVIRSNNRKKEDQLKIEMFLEDYKAMKPTRYSYTDIKKITHHFNDKLGQGGYGSVYKGRISNEVLVAVKVLNSDSKSNGDDFINEVGTIGQIHHVNVVRLVGYCADGCNRALIYEFLPNNSLEKFVRFGKDHKNKFLGWEKMQQIALGIAKGIEYLHQGCAQQILHFDIKPHNILLDQNLNPKISDFGLAKLCSKDQSAVSMTVARGTMGYIAPEVFSRNFGKVSSKSDVYSFGMLLLEMVGAKNNDNGEQDTSESYFPEWIYCRLEQGGEVSIQIEKEDDSNIARKLTIVGLWCIGWHPVDRPSMKHVIQMLEGEICPAMPPNRFSSTTSVNATTRNNARQFGTDLEAISESE